MTIAPLTPSANAMMKLTVGCAKVIAFGNKDEVLKVNEYLDFRGQTTKNQVKNLGVILETDLSFSSHVKAVTKSAYYHLKNIARIRCFVSSQDLKKLVYTFITSRVDYCNGLLTGLPKKTIRQLQLTNFVIVMDECVDLEQGVKLSSWRAAALQSLQVHLNKLECREKVNFFL